MYVLKRVQKTKMTFFGLSWKTYTVSVVKQEAGVVASVGVRRVRWFRRLLPEPGSPVTRSPLSEATTHLTSIPAPRHQPSAAQNAASLWRPSPLPTLRSHNMQTLLTFCHILTSSYCVPLLNVFGSKKVEFFPPEAGRQLKCPLAKEL